MNHLVLVGDSIFDNASYVDQNEAVIDQLLNKLNQHHNATLLAVDGDVTSDVNIQLKKLPKDTTHLFISCGGNDALHIANILNESAKSVGEVMDRFTQIKHDFQMRYRSMLLASKKQVNNITICTVYNSVPDIEQRAITALAMFNEVILMEAFSVGAAVIDLRIVCNEVEDYSVVSPIEPSKQGGHKISDLIIEVIESHDFEKDKSSIYV